MEVGIKARDIMNEDFPILDASLTLESCMKKLNAKQEACVILNKGFVQFVLSYDELLKAFLKRKEKNVQLNEIKARKNFAVIKPETDVFEIIKIMKRGIDFVVVRDKNNIGLITKKELAEVNQFLFDVTYKRE